MRISLSAYVYTVREEGRIVYVCQPLRGPHLQARDVLLGTALAKLANKLRKSINEWIKSGEAHRIQPWLEQSACQASTHKLNLVLRDRTLKLKLMLVSYSAFERLVVFSPSLPDVVFEVAQSSQIADRATEVYTEWAHQRISESASLAVPQAIDMWVDEVQVTVDTKVKKKKKSNDMFAALFGSERMSGSEELYKVGKCLDDVIGDFDRVIGRTELVDEIDQMLQRPDRQNVLVVGARASGKSAIIHECVRRRAHRFRNKRGHKPQVWWLSPQRLISGMSYLGQWEQRWLAILREATKRDHILYFDDLVGLFTAGRTRDSSLTAADVLRSYLAENQVRILAEATEEQLAILRRRSRALADQMHLVNVPSASVSDALPLLIESTFELEAKSNCYFHPETMLLALRHQEIFAPDRAFPGKAIEMTKALAKNASESGYQKSTAITPYNFYHFGASQIGANLQFLRQVAGLNQIREILNTNLIGQPAATEALSKIVIRFAQELHPPDRPLGVLLFLGPTGVGKTESAKALTKLLYHDENQLVRIDMNELTTAYAAEQLVGTFDQPEGRLTSAVRRQPHSVILLDEIEKAHPDVFDYLLQVIGEGRLTDARGRIADFRSSIIIMTSNLGATEQKSSVGFNDSGSRRSQLFRKAAKAFFRPEFINRLDDIVAFRDLDRNDMEQIVRLQMSDVLARDGLNRREAFVSVTDEAVQKVIQSGFDAQLGARAIRRKLEQEIIGPLGDCLAGLPTHDPVLVHISQSLNDSSEGTGRAGRLVCEVTDLSTLETRTPPILVSPEQVITAGEKYAEELSDQLSSLREPLAEADREANEKISDASYYVLREQIYLCTEKLKSLKQSLSTQQAPRLDTASSPMEKPRGGGEYAGARRALIDQIGHEDLRNTIREGSLEGAPNSQNGKDQATQVVGLFATTKAMLDAALEPRDWALGIKALTETTEEQNHVLERDSLLEYYVPMSSYGDTLLLSRLVRCLHHGWNYEVGTEDLPRRYWRVSGIGIAGLLKPLLGTYRFSGVSQSNQLGVLSAIGLPNEATQVQMQVSILGDRVRDESGKLVTSDNQPLPTNVIRGVITEDTTDFVSGSRVHVPLNQWSALDKDVAAWMQWWTNCLPIPEAFIESS